MEHRFAVHARTHALIAAIVLASSPVLAAPKSPASKKEFDSRRQGVQRRRLRRGGRCDVEVVSAREDPETLFAWAQAERKLDNCEKAVELYKELLGYDLPPENKQVIQQNLTECKQVVADSSHKPPPADNPVPVDKAMPPPRHRRRRRPRRHLHPRRHLSISRSARAAARGGRIRSATGSCSSGSAGSRSVASS